MKACAMFVALGLAVVSSIGCSKPVKTCAQEGTSGGKLGPPWQDLGVAGGEICESTPTHLKFILPNEPDAVGASTKIHDKLEAKGFKEVEGSLNIGNIGKGDDSWVSIYAWNFKKGDQTIDVKMDSYPRSSWKDNPVSFTLDTK